LVLESFSDMAMPTKGLRGLAKEEEEEDMVDFVDWI
jgi:hypothetical protein